VTSAGVVTTLAGSAGNPGSADGTGSAARFRFPAGMAVDGSGNVYVADSNNSTIRKVTSAGVVTTLAGSAGTDGSADGTGSAAQFFVPIGVAVDGSGNVYVADSNNNTIREVTPAGVVSTLAGLAGTDGSADGTGSAAQFSGPSGVAVDGSGNVYVADSNNSTIRKVTPAGVVTTLAGSAGNPGSADGTGSAAQFSGPSGVAVDGSGNVYVADAGNDTIRKVTPAGVVTTLAGSAGNPGSADGTGSTAQFYQPGGVAVDGSGNVYVADAGNNTIRMVTPGGAVQTIGGTPGVLGGADGTGAAAGFSYPYGIAVSASGTLFVADKNNNRISIGIPSAALPIVVTAPATSITSTSATLTGTVNANNSSTVVSFDYGPTTSYGTSVPGTPTPVTGNSTTPVSAALAGLTPGTTYHFRVNGTNGGGTSNGTDLTFTTLTALDDWRQAWYGPGATNSGPAADSADPYERGLTNLEVFAFFGPTQNPATAQVSQLPDPQMSGGNFVCSFTQPAGVSGVTYGAEWSATLQNDWQPVPDTGTGTQHVFSMPIGNTRYFLRLTVSDP